MDKLVQHEIDDDTITGAVLVVGHGGQIAHQKAFGFRALAPRPDPMTVDTMFDLASLTKVVATAPSVMRLVQQGHLRLEDPVFRHLPEFGANGKEAVTVRHLLTHYSGLKPDLDLTIPWEGRETAFRMANEEKLQAPPGAQFVYSDINFIVLGELVQQLSGMTLEAYAEANIFEPLKMNHTRFLPPASWTPKIAETLSIDHKHVLRGVVQDMTAERMGGAAGHAGVFSTGGDLAIYAQAMIDRKTILAPDIIEKMTTPQQPPNATEVRGLGWDIDSSFSTNRGTLLPVGSFGHTGFTGTSIWIDPYTDTYIILLTNTVHPRLSAHPLISLRGRVANAVAIALNLDVSDSATDRLLVITGYSELATAARRIGARNGHVLTGIDVLEKEDFRALKRNKPKGCCATGESESVTIGLLTNQTGLDANAKRTVDVLVAAPGVKLAAIFSPEHGIFGAGDTTTIGNTTDSATGVPVYSLYGDSDAKRRPPLEVLKTLDAVVVDVQDAGTRFYTYETTLGYLLEAAAQADTEVIVLDRPNPITGSQVQGPISEADLENFNNYYPVPLRHGMTLGELAQLFNKERNIGARLHVIPMQGWLRGDWFDSTGIVWVNPSPNLRSTNANTLYPGVGLIERTNVSVGRGTDTPFEVMGAPWIEPHTLADYLNARLIAGVRFVPVNFTPNSGPYSGQSCGGVNLIVTDRNTLDSPELGLELAAALKALFANNWKMEPLNELLVNQQVYDALARGDDPRNIAQSWQAELQKFRDLRSKYLLYK
ncbi:MAG TPA: exo-beta-N-acetylmuramidase NamZ domain-containing protein [Terriglobales bacterium]